MCWYFCTSVPVVRFTKVILAVLKCALYSKHANDSTFQPLRPPPGAPVRHLNVPQLTGALFRLLFFSSLRFILRCFCCYAFKFTPLFSYTVNSVVTPFQCSLCFKLWNFSWGLLFPIYLICLSFLGHMIH